MGPPKVGWARRPAWFALDSPQTLCFRFPGANLGPGVSGLEARRPAWFALDSPQALCFRFPGANLGPGVSRLETRRPTFPRRGLLPANRKPLQFRFGEQILHTNSAPTPTSGRLFRGAVCSPLPANPCGSVPGSKIFTLFPRRRLPPAAFFRARFAPRTLLALAAPFRGAKSSHNFRAPTGRPVPGGPEPLHAAPPRKKHLVGFPARCFPLSNSSPAGSVAARRSLPFISPAGPRNFA